MKAKTIRIVLLTVAVLICLSVGLYAAHSYVYGKASPAASVSAADNSGMHEAYTTPIQDLKLKRLNH